MPRATPRDPIYRGRRFSVDVIELCVRWYITYRLSYRDLVAMMAERGVGVAHTTILRWCYGMCRNLRSAGHAMRSRCVDETYTSVRGRSHYLYRAVDRHGKSVNDLLYAVRNRELAQAFFRKAVLTHSTAWPSKVNLDGNAASHLALRLLGVEDPRWQHVMVRARRHRAGAPYSQDSFPSAALKLVPR